MSDQRTRRRARKRDQMGQGPTATSAPVIEELGDRRIEGPDAARPRWRGVRIRWSLPGALVGVILVAATALGAAALSPLSPLSSGASGDNPTAATEPATEPATGAGEASDSEATKGGDDGGPTASDQADKAADEAAASDAPDFTAKAEPTDKPEPKPDPTKPPSEALAVAVGLKDGHPVVEWGSCDGLAFDYYKVVRSTDSMATWPLGTNDHLVAVVGPDGNRRAWDKESPTALKLWYRVFCVRSTDGGYVVRRASAARGIWVPQAPEPTPTPDPVDLAFEAGVGDDGFVHLGWAACNVDGFTYYKVVRSTTTDNPSYFPWTDGTELIAVLGEPGQTSWVDEHLDGGATAWYRVQCIGYLDGSKVLLGQSNVVAVTMP